MPYVFDVPRGPEQDDTVAEILALAKAVRAHVDIQNYPGPLGSRRMPMCCSGDGAEKAVAGAIKLAYVPHRARMKGGSSQ